VVACCERGNEHVGYTKFVDWLMTLTSHKELFAVV
jgi:hypothetical protein